MAPGAEPCAHLERLIHKGVLRGLVHRGGIRADVLSRGELHTDDPIRVAADERERRDERWADDRTRHGAARAGPPVGKAGAELS